MKKHEPESSPVLQHVDPRRRGFLAKLIAGGVALPVMSTVTLGQADGQGKGKGGAKGKGKGGAGKGAGQAQDPAALAARMISQFDKDGDRALNARELEAALRSMRERRGEQGPGGAGKGKGGGAGKGKGGAGKGKGGAGKGKGKGTQVSQGVTPNKPGQ